MARNFAGGAATDNISTTYAGNATQRTWSFWLYQTSNALDTFRRVFSKGSAVDLEFGIDPGDFMLFTVTFNAATGIWNVPRPSLNVWHHYAIVFDVGLDSNNPIIYVDGSSQTVTEPTPPSGTVVTSAGVYMLGNRISSQNRAWAGRIAEFSIHNALFNANEVMALARGRLAHELRFANLATYYPLWGVHTTEIDVSPSKTTGTVTGATRANHPPVRTFTRPRSTGMVFAEVVVPPIAYVFPPWIKV